MQQETRITLTFPCVTILAFLAFLALPGCSGGADLFGDATSDGTTDPGVDLADSAHDPDAVDSHDTATDPLPDGPAHQCEPEVVYDDFCVWCDVFVYLGAFWDGQGCFEMWGCGCAGEDCVLAHASLADCMTAHAACDGAVCEATVGSWFPASAGFCGFKCGGPADWDCFAPFADCLCPVGQTFVAGAGCEPDPGCDDRDLCNATRGAWHPSADCFCGFTCGFPNDCEACVDCCDCGTFRNFVPGEGCVDDPSCGDVNPEDICEFTGGTWHDCAPGDPFCSCGDYYCGRPNVTDPCVMPGCDCGPLSNFTYSAGCAYDGSCVFRGPGAECSGSGSYGPSCREGLVCCEGCGMMPGCPTCQEPCCPDPAGYCMGDGCPVPPP